ncbi:MAG: MBOAT family O-acyltransferase, partial [Isosphaeraceae bacterium]
LIVAIVGVVNLLKAIDWLAHPRFEDDRLRVVLALSVWPALWIEDVGIRIDDRGERMVLGARRLAGGALGLVAGLLLAAIGEALDLPARGPWADGAFKVFEIYALAGGANSLMVGAFALAGYRVADGIRYPVFASSVLDFWSRYNVWVHGWLERHIFEPIGRRGRRPALGILAVFGLSGLYHEYLFLPAVPEAVGFQLAFFSLHGLGAVAGAGIGRLYRARTGRRIPHALAVAATIAFVLATAPLFLHSLNRVVDLHRDLGARVLAGWSG